MEAKKGLQAILLLADSFTTKLEPITLECPKVLLPLVNTPMINYTLAWLQSADVEQVFVLCCCCSHSDQIINYLDNSEWVNQPKPNFSVTTIVSHSCTSAGDALRFIYQLNVIQGGDFILVSGGTVSNMMLKQALQQHKHNNALMTMLIKQSEPTTDDDHDLIMAIDPTTKQLLYYEDKDKAAVDPNFDNSFLTVNPCLSLNNDKQDCYIDICSTQVLSLFTENSDYQHLRRHFVKGLLADDLMGFKIFTHEIHSTYYAARIDNFRSYDAISRDIIIQSSSGIYCACNITPQVQVGSFTYIGKDTIIGNNTIISNSVVGDGCKIGSNVAIDGCYIWSNVTIQDGCKLRHAVLCDGVVMKSGSVLEPGVVLSYKVVVGQDTVVPRYSKVSLLPQPGNTNNGIITDNKLENGCGFIWSVSEEEWKHSVAPITESVLTQVLNDDLDSDTASDEQIFEKEVKETFLQGVEHKVGVNYIIHQLQPLWFSYNMSFDECAGALLYSMMKLALDKANNSGADLVKETNDVISKWGNPLLKPFLKGGIDVEIKMILKFEEMCLEYAKEYATLFMQVLYVLRDKDIIQDEAILNWGNEKDHVQKLF